MKTAVLTRFSLLLLALFFFSCGSSTKNENVEINLKLAGEMLFEGSNTLQFSGKDELKELSNGLGIDMENIKGVAVSTAVLILDDSSRAIAESLLLQIVSDNQELVTIGTLSPLPEGNEMKLTLAEETSILSYLNDEGLTWVLDLNLTEDHLDEMTVNGIVTLTIDYVPTTK